MEYYLEVWQKFATFSGRARRAEYWYFQLFNIIAIAILGFVALSNPSELIFTLLFVYFLAILLPVISVTIRRLHDIDFSGWWILINFVPFGGIVLFIFTLMPGTKGPNRFGEDPIVDNTVSSIPAAPAATTPTAPTAAAMPTPAAATADAAAPNTPTENNQS